MLYAFSLFPEKEKGTDLTSVPRQTNIASACSFGFVYDLFAVVMAARLADAVVKVVLAAVRAFYHVRRRHLAVARASLVAACLRHFPLRNCHDATSFLPACFSRRYVYFLSFFIYSPAFLPTVSESIA